MNVNPVVRLEHCGALSANRPSVTHVTTCDISIPQEETINDRTCCVLKEDNVLRGDFDLYSLLYGGSP